MKWNDSVASRCRYGDWLAPLFDAGEVIWEHAEADYQGFANVLVAMPDGSFVHYEWTYGSCSGCDEWEARGLSEEQVRDEAKRVMAVLNNEDHLQAYLQLDDACKKMRYPSANDLTNGSAPGMLRVLTGGVGEDFRAMGEAATKWLNARAVS
jgi:hypothetical protein